MDNNILTQEEAEALLKDAVAETIDVEAKIVDDSVKELELDNKKEEPKKKEKKVITQEDIDLYTKSVDDMIKLAEEGKLHGETSNPDAICMYEILKRIKKDRGQVNFSVYNKMTPNLKAQIKQAAAQNGIYDLDSVRSFAKTMALQMYQDNALDNAWKQLQEDINKANRMPEQMDIFGSVIYDKMVKTSLVKDIAIKEKDPEHYTEGNLFIETCQRFLDHWFFISMIGLLANNRKALNKAEKNMKRNIEDINYTFEKLDIKISAHTDATTLSKNIADKFSELAAGYLIAGIAELLATCKEKNVYGLQTAFTTSLIMGVLAFINTDEEVQTPEGAILFKNFMRFLTICDKLVEEGNEEWMTILQEAEKEKEELFNKEKELAKTEYESKYNKQLQEETKECSGENDTVTSNAAESDS